MWNKEKFQEVYALYESSGLKVSDFCRNECINEAKFYYWKKQIKQKQEAGCSDFIPILLGSSPQKALPEAPSFEADSTSLIPSTTTTSRLEIVCPDGTSIRLEGYADSKVLKVLLSSRSHV